MRTMPRLWQVLVKDLALDHGQSWSLWAALHRARWSQAVQWRQAFLDFAQRPQWTAAEDVERFFREVVTVPQLVTLIEALIQEGALFVSDGRRLEEHVLERADAQGEWKHLTAHRGRKGVDDE